MAKGSAYDGRSSAVKEGDGRPSGGFNSQAEGRNAAAHHNQVREKMFPDWSALEGAPDFERLNRANDNRRGRGFHFRIRSDKRTDWFYCFALPLESIEQLAMVG